MKSLVSVGSFSTCRIILRHATEKQRMKWSWAVGTVYGWEECEKKHESCRMKLKEGNESEPSSMAKVAQQKGFERGTYSGEMLETLAGSLAKHPRLSSHRKVNPFKHSP